MPGPVGDRSLAVRSARPGSTVAFERLVVRHGVPAPESDVVVTEEPLEIRIRAGAETATLAVTMRTPGHDFELATGFLFAEGVVTDRHHLGRISYCADRPQLYNIVVAELRAPRLPDLSGLDRHFAVNSACGVCGKASLENLEARGYRPLEDGWRIEPELLSSLPDRLRDSQGLFARTGGLHAAALFDRTGRLIAVREDVGRHNALDKLFGWALLEGRVPLSDAVVVVSGRAGYELVQKTVAAGAPILAAVSAPSSLAVETARRFGLTLVGFLRGPTFNVYAGASRISTVVPSSAGGGNGRSPRGSDPHPAV